MTRLPGAVVLAALLLAPGAASAAGCPPFTSPTRKIPLDGERSIVLPKAACVDKESREQKKPIPLPPKCAAAETPAYRNGAWRCAPAR